MPGRPEGLVLTVDPNVIHKVDTANAQNLFNMWTVFSRCADSVEQGRRLENLSWRLWNRETFCCDTTESKLRQATSTPVAATAPKDIPELRIPEVPQLSGSVDSIAEYEEAIEFSSESEPMEISRPRILRQDSNASNRSRGRERHITSDHLEKMVVSIIQDKEPNLVPLAEMSSPSLEPESDDSQTAYSSPDVQQTPDTPTTPTTEPMCHSSVETQSVMSASVSSGVTSSTSGERAPSRTTVIRGFSPSQVSIPTLQLRSQESMKPLALGGIPEPEAAPAYRPVQLKGQPAKFALGGSSGHDNQVSIRTIQTQDSDEQSDSYIDESAIDDDEDDSEWEDSIEEAGKESMDDPLTFKRVPSKPNLTSHRSNLSLMFAGAQDQRPRGGLGAAIASQSTSALQRARTVQHIPTVKATSPNDSDDSGLEMKDGMRHTPLRPINEVPRSTAQPIMTSANGNQRQSALSPRTTRRNMLHNELTESLHRQLLWERQQKTSTANAVLKRRHTSHDVANLKQYPEKVCMKKTEETQEEPNATSWNQYLERDAVGGYHAQGW
ncbi:hypothetical protein PG985_005447 [Apiospora marii]|uniref:uncharacterized protein n=1 Tax=Apiospora marii TaxID=335849 RepID=UPI00312CDE2C